MRFLAILAVSAAVLMPALASADPGQTQAAPAAESQTVPAQQTAQAAPPAASTASNVDLDKIECRTSPPLTGTRLGGSRECHTLGQWNQRERDAQANLAHAQTLGHQVQALNTPGGK